MTNPSRQWLVEVHHARAAKIATVELRSLARQNDIQELLLYEMPILNKKIALRDGFVERASLVRPC